MDNDILASEIEKWESNPTLISQLPIVFKEGTKFETVELTCLECDQTILQNNLHGKINRPLENLAQVNAVGWCDKCNSLTSSEFRVRSEDGELILEWLDKEKGWCRSTSQKNIIDKLLRWFL